MDENLTSSIIVTMAPVFVIMIGLVVYSIAKNRNKVSGRSKHETDALIEAQAMLAKYQKEQAEKDSKKEETTENKTEKTEDKKSEEKPEIEEEQKSKDSKQEEKTAKPKADAPISDTTELEPDIDKTEDK